MTGLESVAGAAAAKSVGGVAGKALKSGGLETAALLEEAKGSKELQHAAKQRAHRLAVRETFMNKLFAPLAKLVNMKADYFDGDEFAEDMAQKTAHLGEDDIVAPKANVAAQAMQGLGISLDEPDLKEMYLNLLATASTKGRDHQAHPAFAGIIRQLAGEEASALVPILAPGSRPMCRIHRVTPGQEGNAIVFNHYLNVAGLGIAAAEPAKLAAWVDNWARLGLVEAAYDRFLTAEKIYDWIESDPLFSSLKAQSAAAAAASPEVPGHLWGYDRGFLSPTAFGVMFRDAVMSFETPGALLGEQSDPPDDENVPVGDSA
jgi:hypothetical protein